MTNEVEIKILEIDQNLIIKKLEELGAEKIQETRLTVDWYRPIGSDSDNAPWYLRIRGNSEGTFEVTWKGKSTKEMGDTNTQVSSKKEINFLIAEPDKLADLFTEIGLEKYAHQEKDRISFKYKDFSFDIDTYPGIPTYLEIEGPDEESIKEMMKTLELDNHDTDNSGERILIETRYGQNWSEMRFDLSS